MKVVCNLRGVALRAKVGEIISGHFVRFKPLYVKRVGYFARKYELSWEAAYILLVSRDPPYKDEDFAWAREQPPLALLEEQGTNFGCEVTANPPKTDLKEKSDDIGTGET